jgi:hypothetical protein
VALRRLHRGMSAKESVLHAVRVAVGSRNCPKLVEARRATRTARVLGAGNVVCGQFAFQISDEAVVKQVDVVVTCGNCSESVDVRCP